MEWASREFGFTWEDPPTEVKLQLAREIVQTDGASGMRLSVCSQRGFIVEAVVFPVQRISPGNVPEVFRVIPTGDAGMAILPLSSAPIESAGWSVTVSTSPPSGDFTFHVSAPARLENVSNMTNAKPCVVFDVLILPFPRCPPADDHR
jgi:hypothetical protein